MLYTDGLVETRGEHLDRGFERLEKAVLGAPKDLEELCTSVFDHTLADPEVDDDVTLLVLGTVSSHDPRVVLSVPGNPTALHGFRVTARRWLAAASGDATEVDEITMAVNEAVQNAIEHGHGRRATPVTVVLERAGDDLEITVSDRGSWTEGATADRGRGLALMRAHMDEVTVLPTEAGTSLVLHRTLRHPAPAGARVIAPR